MARFGRTLRALALSTHPIPSLGVTVIAVAFGIGVGLEPWRLSLLALISLLNQASVGLSNDWLDAARDRNSERQDKPVATGQIAVRTVRATALVTFAGALLLAMLLGWGAAAAHALALVMAWAYNLGLKSTVASFVPYAVSFGLLPVVVSLAQLVPGWPAPRVVVAAVMLGIAGHFANVLPDLDADRDNGVRGLPQRLGQTPSGAVICIALAIATVSLATGHERDPPELVLVLVSGVAVAGSAALVLIAPVSRWIFRGIIITAVLDVGLIVTELSR